MSPDTAITPLDDTKTIDVYCTYADSHYLNGNKVRGDPFGKVYSAQVNQGILLDGNVVGGVANRLFEDFLDNFHDFLEQYRDKKNFQITMDGTISPWNQIRLERLVNGNNGNGSGKQYPHTVEFLPYFS